MNHAINTVHRTKPSQAESTLDLSNHESFLRDKQLVITTRKSDLGLRTTAMVQSVANGRCTFIIGGGRDGDFHRRLLSSSSRATDKAVRAQHSQALAGLDDLIVQVRQHYLPRSPQSAPALGSESSSNLPAQAA